MENFKGDICLVAFFTSPEVNTLLHTLKNLGYRTELIQKKIPSKHFKENDYDIIILFLADHEDIKKQIHSFVDSEKETPVFLILLESNQQWDMEIVRLCSDFACWPISAQELVVRLDRMFTKLRYSLIQEVKEKKLVDKINFIGNSHSFLNTLKKVKKLSQYDVTTLIEGETGTGKDLIARTIHQLSSRSNGPFISVNCGAIPDGLFENELFGHQKGAFTNAYSNQIGWVQQANEGSLFLDEIDTLTFKGQITLLRFLQDSQYKPLGQGKVEIANVRIIAATNSNLWEKVKNKQFRIDLFYRLRVLDLQIPPLRDRGNDSKDLAKYFLNIYKELYNQPSKFLDPKFLDWIQTYNWPGNVRELENLIHREFILSEVDNIGLCGSINGENCEGEIFDGLGPFISIDRDFNSAKAKVICFFEKKYLNRLLSATKGNVTLAAKRAGKERRALGKLLKKHNISSKKKGTSL